MSASAELWDEKNVQASAATMLASFAAQSWDLPREVLRQAKLSIADAVGIALASHRYAFADKSLRAVEALAGAGACTVIGKTLRLCARDASLANGLLVHGLDYDDTHPPSIVHPTASAWPAALAVAQERGATGRQALEAYVLGVETSLRLGEVAGGFQAAGFHPTGIVGTFGAALAAGRLMQLPTRQLLSAQGIALSLTGGSMAFLDDGAWTKRLHPGWSASAGITAATLAASGFEGPADAYESRYGLYQAFLKRAAPEGLRESMASLGRHWKLTELAIKPYPVCHYIHAFADAALTLQADHHIDPGQIEHITLHIHPDQIPVVCEPEARKKRPSSDYDAKFSAQFVVAAALIKRRFTLAELEDEVLQDQAILELCDRVQVVPDEEQNFPAYFPGSVTIRTRDSKQVRYEEPINRGAAERPLSEDDIRSKFFDNTAREPQAAQGLWDLIMELDEATTLEPLARALTGDSSC